MATETIGEFLAGIGFKVDDASERRFISAIEGATLRAKLLGDAIEATARSVIDSVGKIAEQFEQLFYQSKQFGGSAASIKAFEYAVSQLGGTIEGARSSLVNFGRWIKETPGSLEFLARQFKIQTKNIDGSARDVASIWLDINERLSHMPRFLQKQWRETFGVDEQTQLALNNSTEAAKRYADALKSLGGAGVNQGAVETAVKFEKAWRDVWMKIGNMADGGYSKLLSALTDPMQKFGEWLDRNSPKINDAISRMATSVGALTTAWVDDLNKVHWPEVAKDIDDTAKSIAGFVVELRDLVKWLIDLNEMSKSWWITKFLNRTAGGTEVKPLPSGPGFVASHGPGVGGGLWQWLKDNWGIKQNGVPVSDSNPLAVKVTDSGGFFSNLWGSIKEALGVGGGAQANLRARAVGGEAQGNEKALAQSGYNYLRSQGLSHDAALAVLGNARGENGLGSLRVGDNGTAFGQFQWHSDRVADILKNTGIDVRTASFADQLKAFRWEAEHGAGGGHIWEALKHAKSREEAIWLLVHNFERSGNQASDAALRLGYADRYGRSITGTMSASPKMPISWDTGPAWAAINAHIPVGPSSVDNSNRNVSSSVTNNITVNSPDPQSAASMVGVHLDRTSNDISRNLQGAFQ